MLLAKHEQSVTDSVSQVPSRRQQARRGERHRHNHDVQQLPPYLGNGFVAAVACEARQNPRCTARRLAVSSPPSASARFGFTVTNRTSASPSGAGLCVLLADIPPRRGRKWPLRPHRNSYRRSKFTGSQGVGQPGLRSTDFRPH